MRVGIFSKYLLAILLTSCSFFGHRSDDDQSSSAPIPSPGPGVKIPSFKTPAAAVDYLNLQNPATPVDAETFDKAVDAFTDSGTIYSRLSSDDARKAFITALLKKDATCSAKYESKAVCSEPFICAHFSLKMYLKYREDDVPQTVLKSTIEKYNVTQVERKKRIPIYDVSVNIRDDEGYHAINAIKLSSKTLTDPSNWQFLEPQGCKPLFVNPGWSESNLVSPGNVYLVMDHYFQGLGIDTGKFDDTNDYFIALNKLILKKPDELGNIVSFEVDDNYLLKQGIPHWKKIVKSKLNSWKYKEHRYDKALMIFQLGLSHPSIRTDLRTELLKYSSSNALTVISALDFMSSSELATFKAQLKDDESKKYFSDDVIIKVINAVISQKDSSSTKTVGVLESFAISGASDTQIFAEKGPAFQKNFESFFELGFIKSQVSWEERRIITKIATAVKKPIEPVIPPAVFSICKDATMNKVHGALPVLVAEQVPTICFKFRTLEENMNAEYLKQAQYTACLNLVHHTFRIETQSCYLADQTWFYDNCRERYSELFKIACQERLAKSVPQR